MVINGENLLVANPIEGMLTRKYHEYGVSHGLSEAGYDIQIKQNMEFEPDPNTGRMEYRKNNMIWVPGRFVLASAMQRFVMPMNLVGVVHDKSSWARRGLSVFNTVIEPGWEGYLTLELVYHGDEALYIPAGAGIAQIIFSEVSLPAQYTGRYQNQKDKPTPAICT